MDPLKKSAYAILGSNYSMVAVAKRIVDFSSNQSLQEVETGTIVIATIKKLVPGLDLIFVTWTSRSQGRYDGICSVPPDMNLRVGEQLILQITQPARFGKATVLSTDICFLTRDLVAWPGNHIIHLGINLPTILQGAPKIRGFVRGSVRPGMNATGPIRWSRQQYKIETDWETRSLEFVTIKTNSLSQYPINRFSSRNVVESEWISWFSRPICPSIIAKDSLTREYIARCLIKTRPQVPRNFDVGPEHAWASWYSLHSAAVNQPKIGLPCGGMLIIEENQTGWCIDVNSGTSLNKGRANQEAIYALVHQASIRSIRGSVMIDFIQELHGSWLENILHTCCYLLYNDPYHSRILYISDDGFMRIIRNRRRNVLSKRW